EPEGCLALQLVPPRGGRDPTVACCGDIPGQEGSKFLLDLGVLSDLLDVSPRRIRARAVPLAHHLSSAGSVPPTRVLPGHFGRAFTGGCGLLPTTVYHGCWRGRREPAPPLKRKGI